MLAFIRRKQKKQCSDELAAPTSFVKLWGVRAGESHPMIHEAAISTRARQPRLSQRSPPSHTRRPTSQGPSVWTTPDVSSPPSPVHRKPLHERRHSAPPRRESIRELDESSPPETLAEAMFTPACGPFGENVGVESPPSVIVEDPLDYCYMHRVDAEHLPRFNSRANSWVSLRAEVVIPTEDQHDPWPSSLLPSMGHHRPGHTNDTPGYNPGNRPN